MDRRRAGLRIRGKVQGVSFRESARAEALRLGLTGWVRNLSDGSVEAVAEGAPEALEALRHLVPSGSSRGPRDGRASAPSEPALGSSATFTVERSS